MKLHDLVEGITGKWVIKNKDGKERRFKDKNSKEAQEWMNSSTPKKIPKVPTYDDQYWDDKERKANDHSFVTPSKKIGGVSTDSAEIDKIIKDHFGNIKTDWTFERAGEIKVEGTSCATRVVRVMFEVTPEDDMGVDSTVQDTQTIIVVRDRQTPTKIKFLKYGT
jgi:hypothetical protein